jgi:hypothetical protein
MKSQNKTRAGKRANPNRTQVPKPIAIMIIGVAVLGSFFSAYLQHKNQPVIDANQESVRTEEPVIEKIKLAPRREIIRIGHHNIGESISR